MLQILRDIKQFFNNRPLVEKYWTGHVVNPKTFKNKNESLEYLNERFRLYPFFKEFMNLYNDVEGKVVMDYGCGPGDDVVGFAIKGKVKKIIGVDVSPRALKLAQEKIDLHGIPSEQVQLLQVSDKSPDILLPDNSVDHIYSQGVIHHTSHPEGILKELYRILKPGGTGRIMVYHKNSLWLHLYTAYVKIVEEKDFPGLTAFEAFRLNVDGKNCPIAHCYTGEEFCAMLEAAGFKAEFLGGYFADYAELQLFHKKLKEALSSSELPQVHKDFLNRITIDSRGYPSIDGKYIGVGGSYIISK